MEGDIGVNEQALSNRPASDPRAQGKKKKKKAEPGEKRHTARVAFLYID